VTPAPRAASRPSSGAADDCSAAAAWSLAAQTQLPPQLLRAPAKALQVRAALAAWRPVADAALLRVLTHGIEIELNESQTQAVQALIPRAAAEARRGLPVDQREAALQLIEAAVADGELTEVTEGWAMDHILIHPWFLVPKVNPSPNKPRWRLIHDTRSINRFIELPHQRADNLSAIRSRVPPGSFLSTLDISAAYRHIEVAPTSKRLLGLRAAGRTFVASGAPFGLNASAYWWGRVGRAAVALCRERLPPSTTLSRWVDDLLLASPTLAEARAALATVTATLAELGLSVNPDKTTAEPAQTAVFVGFLFDTAENRLFLTPVARERLTTLLGQATRGQPLPVRQWQRLAGTLTCWRPACPALGVAASAAFRRTTLEPRETSAPLDEELDHLRWAATMLPAMAERGAVLHLPTAVASMTLTSDASDSGSGAWAAASTTETMPAWRWADELPAEALGESSTARELAAVLGALQASKARWNGQMLQLRLDSAAAVGALTRGHSSRSPVWRAVLNIQRWAAEHDVRLLAPLWLPRAQNKLADSLSRVQAQARHCPAGEWSVPASEMQRVCARLGLSPVHDRFASAANFLCPHWTSRWPDTSATACDAFTTDWTTEPSWIAPPFVLLERVLQRLAAQPTAVAVVVAPVWTRASWWGLLQSLSTCEPVPVNISLCQAGPSPLTSDLALCKWGLSAWLVRERV
jgi:hypothetical protein